MKKLYVIAAIILALATAACGSSRGDGFGGMSNREAAQISNYLKDQYK